MKIGLIDVDSHNFPNLPLMKISAWHKQQGDITEFYDPMFGGHYDKVYMSKVFTFSKDYPYCINADEIVMGGTGYKNMTHHVLSIDKLMIDLPHEIENFYPDYELYHTKKAYGFLTRGCPMNCEFCIVSQKEGFISFQVADLSSFWQGQKDIVLLDPNMAACKDCNVLLKELIKTKAKIDISQGLNILYMDDEKAELLNQMNLKILHFAWDQQNNTIYEKLKYFRPLLKYDSRKLRIYVLTNFNTSHEYDLERIYKLRELDYDPYVMIYEKQTAPKQTKRLARWVNNKFIWRVCERFKDYEVTP